MQIIECELQRSAEKITARRMNRGPNFSYMSRKHSEHPHMEKKDICLKLTYRNCHSTNFRNSVNLLSKSV